MAAISGEEYHSSKTRQASTILPGQLGEKAERWLISSVKRPLARNYRKYIVELLLRQSPLAPSKDGRHVPLQVPQNRQLVDERRGHAFVSNSIRSARYTIWDFLPKQFVFQATRLHNFYFICIGVPQTIPGYSTTGNFTTILPLTFFIVLTMVKEAYDDWRRHRLDKVENNQLATVLRKVENHSHAVAPSKVMSKLGRLAPRIFGVESEKDKIEEQDADKDGDLRWTKLCWHKIRVGDVVKLYRDDAVPADLALLYADGEDGVAYVETMALDGETSLKSKQAPQILRSCSSIAGLASTTADFVCEDPNRNLYDFNGRANIGGSALPLTLNEVLYRGSTLRNTSYAIGLVINTGEECKIRMNANHHPKAKKPRLERYANQVVIKLIIYVVILSVGVSMGYYKWRNDFELRTWYLQDASVGFNEIIVGFLIMFNNVIPLALWVTLEIVKILQLLMLRSDVEMYDPVSDTPMVCNTNTILENLGQVSYVLSDKTGTLTENVMRFRGMSIGGLAFNHGVCDTSEWTRRRCSEQADVKEAAIGLSKDQPKTSVTIAMRDLSPPRTSKLSASRPSIQHRHSSTSARPSIFREDTALNTNTLLRYIREKPHAVLARKALDFILGLALCHTALPETSDDGSIKFQASSPDELALLDAARDLGFLMIQRSSQIITLLTTANDGTQTRETYNILDVIELSSQRKRMSIVVRCPDGKIWLLCKGADSVIVPRLQQSALAARKSHEVRRSMQIERERQRQSVQLERMSTSARPSLAISRAASIDIQRSVGNKGVYLDLPKASQEITVQTRSLDVSRGYDYDFERLDRAAATDDGMVFTRCFRHMDNFATKGLRTLLFAHKVMTPAEYESWATVYRAAATSLSNRQERIEAAAEQIEQCLDLLGASAIEDKLQEGVPDTIDKLRRANMKIWMLTGDKRETAINIAHSAQICKPESEVFILDAAKGSIGSQLTDTAIGLRHGCLHSVLVIDGHTLSVIEAAANLTRTFYDLIPIVDSVVCCRASPSQKAGIVKAIRARIPSALTLAIGDGANDVAMIQASHVGIGVSGKEGLQAARVADFSIAQFRFLQRLLLVHGRWNYQRTAKFILATFWKEGFFYLMQALYQRYNGYTGTSLYENWSLTALNTLFTSLCVLVPGTFEQDLRADTLLAVPELYSYGQKNKGLNLVLFFQWVCVAVVHGMLCWFIVWALYGRHAIMSDNGLFALGDLVFSIAILWTNIKLMLIEMHYKTTVTGVCFTIVVGGWWAWNAFLSAAYSNNLSPYDVKGGFTHTFGNDVVWWLTLVVALAVLTVLDLGYKSVKQSLVLAGKWPPWRRKALEAGFVGVESWQVIEKERRLDEDDDVM